MIGLLLRSRVVRRVLCRRLSVYEWCSIKAATFRFASRHAKTACDASTCDAQSEWAVVRWSVPRARLAQTSLCESQRHASKGHSTTTIDATNDAKALNACLHAQTILITMDHASQIRDYRDPLRLSCHADCEERYKVLQDVRKAIYVCLGGYPFMNLACEQLNDKIDARSRSLS